MKSLLDKAVYSVPPILLFIGFPLSIVVSMLVFALYSSTNVSPDEIVKLREESICYKRHIDLAISYGRVIKKFEVERIKTNCEYRKKIGMKEDGK